MFALQVIQKLTDSTRRRRVWEKVFGASDSKKTTYECVIHRGNGPVFRLFFVYFLYGERMLILKRKGVILDSVHSTDSPTMAVALNDLGLHIKGTLSPWASVLREM